ncbi:hypothetical protein D3C71_2110060 [compost metagenome]
MFRPEAHAAREANHQRKNQARQRHRIDRRTDQRLQRRIGTGMSWTKANHQTDGKPGQG